MGVQRGLVEASIPKEEDSTPLALKRKAVSPGDKSRPFGRDVEASWAKENAARRLRMGKLAGSVILKGSG